MSGSLVRMMLVSLLLAWQPAAAQNLSGSERLQQLDRDTETFVLGNVEFALQHELAHLLVHERNVPVKGSEEDLADDFAAVTLLPSDAQGAAGPGRGARYVLAAAEAFAVSWKLGTASDAGARYQGVHSLDITRYRHLLCLLQGSGFQVSLPLPARLPDIPTSGCDQEYSKAVGRVQNLVNRYGRGGGEAADPTVTVRYQGAETLVARRMVKLLRERRIIEDTMRSFTRRFALDGPVTVAVRQCGAVQTAWLPDSRELAICHEFLAHLYLLSRQRRTNN